MYINYATDQLKELAAKEVSDIAPFLNEDDRGTLILKKIIQMAHDDKAEENKIVAAQVN